MILLRTVLEGLYGNRLERVSRINRWYEIYEGKQGWEPLTDLDYEPTQKITNYTKSLIDKRARFMFGNEPFFDLREVRDADKDKAQEKEDLLKQILTDNQFHSKVLKGYKDLAIAGEVAIKLWGREDVGAKIIFVPAQEYFPVYNEEDSTELESVTFFYSINQAEKRRDQRYKKQEWKLENGQCILNEATYDGEGRRVSTEYQDHRNGLDFIPVIIIKNGGLTGETTGDSDVDLIWSDQDNFNKLSSDDQDALKFQMFGQDVVTDANEESLQGMRVAPGALVDLQTDQRAANQNRQAKMERHESRFSYSEKFQDTINRMKNNMFELMSVPNVGLEQLKGLMQSGKSMEALYWDLIIASDEDRIEWNTAFTTMTDYIFRMIEEYNLYGAKELARVETTLDLIYGYPLPNNETEEKETDMKEVVAQVKSRESYINKWGEVESVDRELEQIREERQMLEDTYTLGLFGDLEE